MSAYLSSIIFFLVLQWVMALGRCYVRLVIVRKFGWDDAAMVLTLLVSTAFSVSLIYVNLKAGIHTVYVLRPNVVIATIHVILAAQVTYILASTLLKVALGLLLLRVLIKKWQVYTIYTVMAISVSYGISYFFVVLFQCGNPIYYPWRIIIDKVCLSHPAIEGTSYTHAVVAAFSDWAYAILPMIYLYSSKLDMRSKISVGFILGLGSIGSICTLIRIGWIHYLTGVTATFLITARGIAVMSAAELSIGITCISLACYKPFFQRFFPRSSRLLASQNSRGSTIPMAVTPGAAPATQQIYTPQTNRYMRNASREDLKSNVHVFSGRASTEGSSDAGV